MVIPPRKLRGEDPTQGNTGHLARLFCELNKWHKLNILPTWKSLTQGKVKWTTSLDPRASRIYWSLFPWRKSALGEGSQWLLSPQWLSQSAPRAGATLLSSWCEAVTWQSVPMPFELLKGSAVFMSQRWCTANPPPPPKKNTHKKNEKLLPGG